MTPIDSGLGSIYSVALSGMTLPSCAPTQTGEKVEGSIKGAETEESSSSPDDRAVDSPKNTTPSKTEMVTMETQTSPTTEVCPILFVKSANADDQEQDKSLQTSSGKRDNQPLEEDCINLIKSESKTDGDNDDKEKNAVVQESPPTTLLQVKEDESNVIPENVLDTETAKLSIGNDKQTKPSETPSPVLVTVSLEECNDDKTVSISASLR